MVERLTDVPILGTIVPNMGTSMDELTIAAALFDKTRRSILALLYTHPDEAFHVRAVARAANAGMGAVHRELQRLAIAGILLRRVEGRQVYYQANRQCPIFADLQGLVIKTMGVADVLRGSLAGLADRIELALLYGSLARGTAGADSDVDVLIVGTISFAEAVAALRPAQEALRREVNPSIYPPAEFSDKLASGNHFLTTVIREPHVFLIGGEHELARLAAPWLGDGAPDQPPGDR